ncbi:MAG: DMT family transporter [Bacteroidota bacterium]
MIFLLFSILLSVLTVCFFKLFERYQVHTFQAILVNYITCIIVGNIISPKAIILQPFWNEPWFLFALVLGFVFISVFYSIGLTTQKMGVSVSMVAAKLSVVIPVGAAFLLHGEGLGILKIIGVLVSLVAVFLISNKQGEQKTAKGKGLWLLPLYVFLGSGVIDATLKHMQKQFIPPGNAGDMVSTIFLVAFLFGMIVLLYKRETFQVKSIPWGIALGIPNFFCMFFLVKTLERFDATFIFPINNIAVVVCSTLVSLAFFKEKMSVANWIGFALAIVSILIISFA